MSSAAAVTQRSKSGRAEWLDTLRGAAALLVVLDHYVWAHVDRLVALPFDPGVFGVSVFFLISGYIIPKSVGPIDRSMNSRVLVAFLVNRFFRLYPVYWVAILIGALVYGSSQRDTLVNLTMFQRFGGVENIIGASWTLQIELVFYIWICVAIATASLQKISFVFISTIGAVFLALACAVVRFHVGIRAPVAIPIGFSIIMTGYWIFLWQSGLARAKTVTTVLTIVTVGLLVTFFLSYARDWGYKEEPWRFVWSDGLALVVFAVAFRFRLSLPVMSLAASISYPIYLFHQPIEEAFSPLRSVYGGVTVEILSFSIVILLSLGVHLLVERPFRRIGHSMARTRWLRERNMTQSI